jgi:uncharacterized protein (TIGR03083 family)
VTATVPVDNGAARLALRAGADRLVHLLRAVDDADTPIPDSEWTIRQAAAHVVAVLGDYGDSLAGTEPLKSLDPALGPTSAQTRAVNAIRMEKVENLGLDQLATAIDETVSTLLAATDGMPGDDPFDWYGRCETTRAAMTSVMLGEVLVHGYDMATAAKVSWPIDRRDATLILLGALDLMPAYVDSVAAGGVTSSYELSLRQKPGPPLKFGVRFAGGAVEVDIPGRPPFDCRINADPRAMLLVSYGRMSPWLPALKGQIVAWGRKPWLGLTFSKLIMNP